MRNLPLECRVLSCWTPCQGRWRLSTPMTTMIEGRSAAEFNSSSIGEVKPSQARKTTALVAADLEASKPIRSKLRARRAPLPCFTGVIAHEGLGGNMGFEYRIAIISVHRSALGTRSARGHSLSPSSAASVWSRVSR